MIAPPHLAGPAALTWPVICNAFAMQQKLFAGQGQK
jgi:hypothetical protein